MRLDEIPDMTPAEKEAVVMMHLQGLANVFESVQILVSSTQSTGTGYVFKGSGNWFARQGMAQAFVQMEQAQETARVWRRVEIPVITRPFYEHRAKSPL